MNHEMLMETLTKVKIDPFWFRHYLLNRSQAVKINNTVSTTSPIRFVVSQGLILGPVLVTILTNDLTETINDCLVVQYADNTQFVHSGTVDTLPHLIARAETTLSRAKSYFNNNGLFLNSNKTQCLFVGTRPAIRRVPDNTTINLNNTSITFSKQVKNLGVYMDQHMSFEVHIHEMHKKVMGILLLVNRIRDNFDDVTRKIVIQSLALSSVNYCIQVYGTTNNTHVRRVQKLQNFAAEICAEGTRRSDHATPFITQLEWLKIDKKVIFDVAVTVFKVKNKIFPDWFV